MSMLNCARRLLCVHCSYWQSRKKCGASFHFTTSNPHRLRECWWRKRALRKHAEQISSRSRRVQIRQSNSRAFSNSSQGRKSIFPLPRWGSANSAQFRASCLRAPARRWFMHRSARRRTSKGNSRSNNFARSESLRDVESNHVPSACSFPSAHIVQRTQSSCLRP